MEEHFSKTSNRFTLKIEFIYTITLKNLEKSTTKPRQMRPAPEYLKNTISTFTDSLKNLVSEIIAITKPLSTRSTDITLIFKKELKIWSKMT